MTERLAALEWCCLLSPRLCVVSDCHEQESGDDLNLPLAWLRPAGGRRVVMSVWRVPFFKIAPCCGEGCLEESWECLWCWNMLMMILLKDGGCWKTLCVIVGQEFFCESSKCLKPESNKQVSFGLCDYMYVLEWFTCYISFIVCYNCRLSTTCTWAIEWKAEVSRWSNCASWWLLWMVTSIRSYHFSSAGRTSKSFVKQLLGCVWICQYLQQVSLWRVTL